MAFPCDEPWDPYPTVRVKIEQQLRSTDGLIWYEIFNGKAMDLNDPSAKEAGFWTWQFRAFGRRYDPKTGNILKENCNDVIGKCRVTYL